MKKKLLFIGLSLFISITAMTQNKTGTYRNLWKQVENLENESLPQSATKTVDDILSLAIKESNNQQTIKALIYKGKFNEQIERSNHNYLIEKFEKQLSTTKDVSEKSLLSSMLAQVYLSAYNGDRWNIDQLTPIQGSTPADLKEWSRNIYTAKIQSLLKQSIANRADLLKKYTNEYDVIIDKGNTESISLYDFFALRAINMTAGLRSMDRNEVDLKERTGLTPEQLIAPANEYLKLQIVNKYNHDNFEFSLLQDYMQSLSDRKLRTLLVQTEIMKVELVSDQSKSISNKQRIEIYKKLLDLYKTSETSIDVRIELISAISQEGRSEDKNEKANSEVYAIAKEGIKQYPNYASTKVLLNKIAEIESPFIYLKAEKLYTSTDEVKIDITHRNLQSLNSDNHIVLVNLGSGTPELIKEYNLPSLTSELPYNSSTKELNIGTLSPSKYQIIYIQKNNGKQSFKSKINEAIELDNYVEFVVSDLVSFYKSVDEKTNHIYVVNSKNGKPVAGVNVKLHIENYDNNKTVKTIVGESKTDNNGLVIYTDTLTYKQKGYQPTQYSISLGNDKFLSSCQIQNSYQYRDTRTQEIKPAISILTDRSIYRPGQIIHFKTIVLDKNKHVMANHKTTVKLINPNGEEVGKVDIKTNDFGSASGDFITPKVGLVGTYSLTCNNETMYVSVEEYKRPTFQLTFDKMTGSYAFGQEVTVTGLAKTYSGVNLQNTSVEYSIRRVSAYLFYNYRSSNAFVGKGQTITDADGKFGITFTPEDADTRQILFRQLNNSVYTFEVTASITDSNGETQSSTYPLTVGNISMMITADIPSKLNKNGKDEIEIKATNLAYEPIVTKGTYKLHAVNKKDSIESTVLTGTFESGKQPKLKLALESVKSGKYRLEMIAMDDKDREVTCTTDFILYSYNDSNPPIDSRNWLLEKNTFFSKNKEAELVYGISDNDGYVLYEVYNEKKIFERKFIKLNNENQTFKLAYKDEYGDGVYVSFARIWNNDLITNYTLIKKEEKEETEALVISLDTFRDKLMPGQKETWAISVKDAKGKVVESEVLASMYDTTLDQLVGYNPWRLNMPYSPTMRMSPDYYNSNYRNYSYPIYMDLKGKAKVETINSTNPIDINWFGYPIYYNNAIFVEYQNSKGIMGGSNRASKVTIDSASPAAGALLNLRKSEAMTDDQVTPESAPESASNNQAQIRENFNETAFFYPQLKINKDGETLISFTVPESNTTWRFRLMAHNADGRSIQSEKMVVTSKKLMVSPNMPRFFRQGDKTSITTRISNLSDETINGNVSLEFFDPTSNELIDLGVKDKNQAFDTQAGQSATATWTFSIPKNIEMLGCRIVAVGGSHSDGEQHALAVLPDRMLVTETLPFDVVEKGNSTFTLDKLANNKSTTLSNYKLTLEYSNSPAWYAIMALPTITQPTNENAVNWFASYYANALGSSIIAQYPKVAAMIKTWKMQGGDKETLVSQLNKNEELKSILLEETPWILDAKNEEEQMTKLSLLFDINNTQSMSEAAINKLSELQTYDGGWSWYAGMQASRSITAYILHGLTQLQQAGNVEHPNKVKEMYMKAVQYLDRCLLYDYTTMKENDKNWQSQTSISTQQLEYMYTRSFYRDIPIDVETREAERFYTNVITKNSAKISLYNKSLLAILLKQNGETETASKLAQSIKEHSVTDKTKGLYWPNNAGYAFLSMSTISTHTFLMDALIENGATTSEINAMKQWLVKQKQTQAWEATHATVYAISSLLRNGSNWFDNAETMAQIKVGNKSVDTSQASKGTGYVKTSWSASEIDKAMSTVTVSTANQAPAYGAMYWQYYEDMNKVTKQKGELNIDKQLYIKSTTDKGEVITAVSSNNPIKIGDKVVVRLTIRNDRTMEFVQIKDMRAACFEPTKTTSGMSSAQGIIYYEATKDASTNFYIDYLAKGTYVLEYSVYATRTGVYSNGITSIQNLYAPEFSSHTQGLSISIAE